MKVIVIGSRIAGLLAARVLSAKFDTVLVVDRDDLNSPELRKGTPQAHHIHALLARGLQLIEAFYPGIISELHQGGVPEYNWTQDILILLASGYALRIDTGLETLALSRQILEQQIRVRTQQISNILWASCQEVKGLVCENGAVRGIQTLNRNTHETDTLYADLVVDASGSCTKPVRAGEPVAKGAQRVCDNVRQ
jgi:flavin-dependent dehydrogenase